MFLTEMGWLSFFNYNIKYLLCVIETFTKYIWVKHLKDKNAKFFSGFIEIVK